MTNKTPKSILHGLLDKYEYSSMLVQHRQYPGKAILDLTEEERKILSELKSEDIETLRPGANSYFLPAHMIKKVPDDRK